MAIFKKTTKTSSAPKAKVSKDKTAVTPAVKSDVLIRPYIKEKSAILADERNTYVFEVALRTNKIEIAKEVARVYGFTPVRVNIINLPSTRVFVRGKNGIKAGTRKALVTLKKGDKINLM